MKDFQKKVLWVIFLFLMLWGLFLAQEALFVLYGAFILASALTPFVNFLDLKLPRFLAVLLPFLLFIIISIVVILPVVDIASGQLQLLIEDFPKKLDQLKGLGEQWLVFERRYPVLLNFSFENVFSQISSQSPAFFSGFTGATIALSKSLLNILSAFIISFFLLLDREKIQNYGLRFLSSSERKQADALINHLIHSTGAFVNGQILFMGSFALLISVGLSILEVPFGLLFGLIAGILTIIPILGPNIAMIPTIIFAIINSGDPMLGFWVFVLFILVQVIENNFVGPLIMGKAVGLHPLAIILSIMLGGLMFGMIGIILAIPLATGLNILLEEWIFKVNDARLHPVLDADENDL